MIKKTLLILLSSSMLLTSVSFMVACKNPVAANGIKQNNCPKGNNDTCSCTFN